MQDRDDRDAHLPEEVDDVVPVRSAEDAVLVLDDDDVARVERVDGARGGAGVPGDPLGGDEALGRLRCVDRADDGDPRAHRLQVLGEGVGEGGQAALGGRDRW